MSRRQGVVKQQSNHKNNSGREFSFEADSSCEMSDDGAVFSSSEEEESKDQKIKSMKSPQGKLPDPSSDGVPSSLLIGDNDSDYTYESYYEYVDDVDPELELPANSQQ